MRSSGAALRAHAPHPAHNRAAVLSMVVAVTVCGLVAALGLPTAAAVAGGPRVVAVLTGTVERVTLDDFAHPLPEGADQLTFVTTADGAVQVPAAALASVANGSTVRVGLADTAGTRVTAAGGLVADLAPAQAQDPQAGPQVATVDVVAVPGAGQALTGTGLAPVDTAVAAGTVAHSVYVVVARPPGAASTSTTAAQVAATINGSVNSYWKKVTGGKVTFTAKAYGKVVTTSHAPCSNGGVSGSTAFWNEIAQATGWTSGSGKHLVVYFPAYSGCGGIAGLGTLGGGIGSGGVTWTNGYNIVGVIGHELGHNLGLGHSELLDCTVGGVRVMDAAPSSCSERVYADTNDIMALSFGYVGFLNAVHQRTLGLLTTASQATPSGNGRVVLKAIEGGTGLRVLTLSDGETHYVVEFRQPTGLDSWMASYPTWGSVGVTVRREFDPAQPGAGAFSSLASYLLDGRPSTPDPDFGNMTNALPVGTWIDLDDGLLAVRVVSMSATGAVVDYRNGPAAGDPRYVPPVVPSLTQPRGRLVLGTMRPGTSGPSVPVMWAWSVTTPPTAPSTTATVVSRRAIAAGHVAAIGWRDTAYRAVALASDGSPVSSTGRARTHYTSEASTGVVKLSRGWAVARSAAANGRALRVTSRRGAAVTFRVTGRSIGVLLARGAQFGSVAVYVDGRRVATVSMRANRTAVVVAFARTFATSGSHVVRLVDRTGGTRGHLGFDGIVSML